MKRIDLHTHSSISDGTFTPSELIKYAKEKELTAIALTDHDTIDGISEAQEWGIKLGIEVIPGVEMTSRYHGKKVHILGYFIDTSDSKFLEKLKHLRSARSRRNEKMIQKLEKIGIFVSLEELNLFSKGDVIKPVHFASVLKEKGYVRTMDEAFEKYISKGRAGYVERELYTSSQCVNAIKENGGLAVLAHPTLYKMTKLEVEDLIKELTIDGLHGIEAVYPLYSNEEEQWLQRIAYELKLSIAGGSDFHGTNKPNIALATGINNNLFVPYKVLNELKNRR